jgi:phosphoribosylformylglycinamidine synthase
VRNIACITNEQRNVYGMMPHPERACAPHLGNTDGKAIMKLLFEAVPELATF